MRFLPVAHRELLAAGRRRSTWIWRCIYFAATLAVCTWAYFDAAHRSFSHQGEEVFAVMVGFMAFYAGIAGVYATADTFGWEKREGTLGLLFLTDLSGWDVVSGKGLAKALNVFYGLLAMLPLLSVPLLLGGVTVGQVGRTALLLVGMMVQSLAIGLWVSSRSTNERRAIMATLGLVLALFLGPVFTAALLDEAYGWSEREIVPVGIPSPLFGMIAAQFVGTGGGPNWPGETWLVSLLCSLAIAGLCLVSASRHLPHSWSPELLAHHRMRREGRWSPLRWPGMALGRIAALRQRWDERLRRHFGARQRRLLDVHPYVWLINRAADKRLLATATTVVLLSIWGLSRLAHGPVIGGSELFYYFFAVLAWLLRIWMLAEPVMRLGEDRRSGALELVMVTPQQGPEILGGIQRAMRRQFGWAVGLSVTVAAVVWWMDDAPGYSRAGEWEWRGLLFMSVVALLVDCFALQWIGPWLGLSSRSVTTGLVAGMALLAAPDILRISIDVLASNTRFGFFRWLQQAAPGHWKALVSALLVGMSAAWFAAAWAYRRWIWPKGLKWRFTVAALLAAPAFLTLFVGYKALRLTSSFYSPALLAEWTHWLLIGVAVWSWAKPALEKRFRDLATAPHRPVE